MAATGTETAEQRTEDRSRLAEESFDVGWVEGTQVCLE